MGRPQFQRAVDQSVTTAQDYEVVGFVTVGNTPAGGSKTLTMTAAAGYLYQLVGLALQIAAPAGATAGTHEIEIYTSAGAGDMKHVRAVYAYNVAPKLEHGYWQGTVTTLQPPANDQVQRQLQVVRFDAADLLKIVYRNNTDVTQFGTMSGVLATTKLKVAAV